MRGPSIAPDRAVTGGDTIMIEAAIVAAFTFAGLLLGVVAGAKPSFVLFALAYAAAGAALVAAVRSTGPRLAESEAQLTLEQAEPARAKAA
ncbi:hypothetical protein ABEG18_18560 [Alsobacter sp. KACC 23698]|uniref:Uncharacterized protein n=1 Tax=Alsobacter sp. KACC 23698 TaxID=3149229 RepID=A0AAU7JBG1_9HYPH